MASFVIEGGHRLSGEIHPQGAKNEVLQIICATLLTAEEVTVDNIPDILDVNNLIQLMREMGVTVSKKGIDSYSFKAENVDLAYLESDEFLKKCSSLRGSVMLIGPMVARFGKALISKPGGDKIGRRRLDTHFLGIQNLGADFRYDEGRGIYEITADRLQGNYMLLDEASVTGTANIVMAAVLAKGTTTIYNAACEPYLQQLCRMLNRMGARISGIASNLLTIEGVEELHGTQHTVLPDMIEVGSFIGMAAMTKSEITIKNVSYENLGIIPESFRRLGIKLEQRGDDIYVPAQEVYEIESFIDGSIMTIADAPWPGLTPDLLSVMLVVATQAKGSVLIHQKMFESRLFFVDKLIDMGAQIILCDPHRAVVIGHNHGFKLRGARLTSPDIRAGIALLIAAMSAEGTSTISNIEQIDRGYKIGLFNKPHGIHGELQFTFTDDIFDRVDCDYLICLLDGIFVPFFMEEYRFRSDSTALVKLEGVDTAERARMFTNVEVYFPVKHAEEAGEGELSWEFFVGFRMEDVHHGMLGEVVDVDTATVNTLFIVEREGEELLVPAQEEFIRGIDQQQKLITVELPEGLLNLDELEEEE